jgi:hypothetical protein
MKTDTIEIGRWRAVKALLAIAACGLLASCASLVGPREVELPLEKLQAGLDRRFPLDNRMLELFDVRLSRPMLSLIPERDRVALTMHAAVAPPFLTQSWNGSLDLSGRLYVDPARGAVFMAEPRVERFVLDGINESYQRQLTKVANILMDQVIDDVPVYSFRMEDLRYGGVQFVPTRMTTTSRGLVVTMEPAK